MIPALFALTLVSTPVLPTPGRECARLGGSDVRYYPIDDRTLVISNGRRAYRVRTTPSAILGDRAAVVNTRFRNTTVVCSPLDLNLQVSSPSGRSGLIVQSLERLPDAEAEALRHGGPPRRR